MSNLVDFYKKIDCNLGLEGHSQNIPEQIKFLKDIISEENVSNIIEIGFNAGHSAEIFLSSNKNINVVSFDIGDYYYVGLGKQFIDNKYPNRHTLILGDSLVSIPEYIRTSNIKFDIIFIDGGHSYNTAKGDLINCKNLAHKKTIVIMDDTVNNDNWRRGWNQGPTKVWNEAKEWDFIKELGSKDFWDGRGLSWGIYNL